MFKIILIPALCVYAASAQTTTTTVSKTSDEASRPMGITAVMAGPVAAIPGAPYSAKAVTQRVQLLSDGNHISQTITNTVARDGKGRVYHEESLPGYNTANADPPHMVLIEDPVAGVHITLDTNAKTAFKLPAAEQKKADEASLTMMSPANGLAQTVTIVSGNGQSADVPSTTIDLGTQTMEGVLAKGTRVTRIIPAGTIGNDGPIVITTETWFSPDLKVLVMSKSNDPRMGETTYKLTNILRTEPDPALFRIPADYTIKEKPANVFFFKKNQSNIER